MSLANSLSTPTPIPIGSGSFGSVYVILGSNVAYKQVHRNGDESRVSLHVEYLYLEDIYLRCNSDSFFFIPRAYAYNDPASPSEFRGITVSPPKKQKRRRLGRPRVVSEDFLPFPRATYAMERVHAFPPHAASILRKAFFPPSYVAAGPTICRLYLGKIFPTTPGRFFNSANFPLDAARYTHLRETTPYAEDLAELPEVAAGMGEMLGRLHIIGGYDARDIEFVLGGDGTSGFQFSVIDFNQMRPWDRTAHSVPTLVQAFFSNDPYYPRPRPQERLYKEFKLAYRQEFSAEHQHLADAFLQAIESLQAERDSANANH